MSKRDEKPRNDEKVKRPENIPIRAAEPDWLAPFAVTEEQARRIAKDQLSQTLEELNIGINDADSSEPRNRQPNAAHRGTRSTLAWAFDPLARPLTTWATPRREGCLKRSRTRPGAP